MAREKAPKPEPLPAAGRHGFVQIPILVRPTPAGAQQLVDARNGDVLGTASTAAIAQRTKEFFA